MRGGRGRGVWGRWQSYNILAHITGKLVCIFPCNTRHSRFCCLSSSEQGATQTEMMEELRKTTEAIRWIYIYINMYTYIYIYIIYIEITCACSIGNKVLVIQMWRFIHSEARAPRPRVSRRPLVSPRARQQSALLLDTDPREQLFRSPTPSSSPLSLISFFLASREERETLHWCEIGV